ncbi:hypothetical protein AOL_s00173g149 [Orbilia oligospora ATCC 24927]|uniref:Uncharacterized protein n=2 Tax=Orbilia oligospora TaxID=2813651 RepID=G1XNY1_ARTOA|nr:hypothetical protein AOL_s00173g149 [Orbilia oligospora ATCC 24927]EGX45048.1 hypothetical protein AOL_s00173g149 [Orbilia oligospora ATCC 24927]KAF3286758.1 hypothetical protein TWF970_008598 [Orbilia oligospora]
MSMHMKPRGLRRDTTKKFAKPLDSSPPKIHITSFPLELLEKISLYVGKTNPHYSWNFCLANEYLYRRIGPSNNFLWYKIVGRFEIPKSTKFIKYHKDFHYATLTRRKSTWPDPKCCGCEASGQELETIQNWSQFKNLIYLLFCQKCLNKYYVPRSYISDLRDIVPVAHDFFSGSGSAINSTYHVYWNRRSERVSKEFYIYVKNVFNIDDSDPDRILTEGEKKELEQKFSIFRPSFIPAEHHRHGHDRSYLEKIIEIYRQEYTSFHFLCTPEYFEELWNDYDKALKRFRRNQVRIPITEPGGGKPEGIRDPRCAFYHFRFYFHRKYRYSSENDYEAQLDNYEGQKAIISKHRYCQHVLVGLFGPGDGIAWRASRVQRPEFLWALFDEWHKGSFGLGHWLPDRLVAKCPYCYSFFQGSVSGGTSTRGLWRTQPKNLLDHIIDDHGDMIR